MFRSRKFLKFLPVIISAAFLGIFVLIIYKYTAYNNDKKEKDVRDKLLELLVLKKSQLEKALSSRVYYTKGIAAYTSINPEITNDTFYKLADELISRDSVISSMSLSRNCIINAIYPHKKHEAAIGLNLLAHPMRKKIVESTIRTRNTFIAGPVTLVEGGVAFISYTPIFVKSEPDSSGFWGVTDIVIFKDKLFNEIGLSTRDANYKFALRGTDGTGNQGKCFWGDPGIFGNNPVTVDVFLPTGSWTLASIPVNGWNGYLDKTEKITIFLYISSFIISILIWLYCRAMIKIRSHEQELKAMFESMQDIIIEFSREGRYVKIAPTNESILFRPKKELLGKSIYEIFDKSTADFFLDGITRCLNTGEKVILDYPLQLETGTYWFQARLSRLSENSVIFVAHDNTHRKKAEEDLKKSEQKLKELNATKDKFFSIIAHDLRSPFSGFMGISEELNKNISSMDRDEISELAGVMHSAAKSTYELLTNLLEWSSLQTGRMKFESEGLNLNTEAEKIRSLFGSASSLKSICINNNTDKDTFICADKNAFSAILRNVLSNAIKFTPHCGKIEISSETDGQSVNISVADSGMGMTADVLAKIFMIDTGYSSKGTDGEKGTGLGLPLCRELVEKCGGQMHISSTPGTGTIVTFSLPLLTK
ncbi:MAG: ATP-binding protein [Bacteroidota bacterium]